MKKKVVWIYAAELVFGIVLLAVAALFTQAGVYDRAEAKSAEHWEEHMEQFTEGQSIVYRTILPSEGVSGKVIGCYSSHIQMEITIDGESVYALFPVDGHWTKTTGYNWNFVSLTEADAGKEMLIRVTPAYADGKGIDTFYYGNLNAVEHLIVKEHSQRFVIALIILFVGVLLLVYVALIVKKGREDNPLLYFSIFATILGVWYLCETELLELFLPGRFPVAAIDHLALMLVPVPFLLFVQSMYRSKEHWIWKAICYFNCAIVMIRLLLQAAGILDLRETLWMTHVGFGVAITMVLLLSIREMIDGGISRGMKLNILCVVVLLFAVILELLEFRTVRTRIPFGSYGFLFYIMVMGVMTLRDTRRMMEQARESELYRKLAFTDELTGLYNRAAFTRDLEERRVPDEDRTVYKILPTVLFMFDLNDLKKCNDNFGHEYGDSYIRMVSEVINSVFGKAGNCYRIGGDEFCSIMDYTSQEDVERRYRTFLEEVKKKDEQAFVVPVSVAAGYAVYDEKKDASLEAAMRRADEMMYENKQKIKHDRDGE